MAAAGARVVLYALQALYSSDRGKAAENLAFFYVPFALLFVLLRDVAGRRELLLRCLGVAVALAVVFAGIGFVEYARKALFLNPKVVAANQYDNYFRVNSLFFDPNIYGRFLALVMIAVTTVVLWWRAPARACSSAPAVLAWLLAGLVTSFSQSSIAALLLGLAVLAACALGACAARCTWPAALVALARWRSCCAAPASLHFGLKGNGGSTSNATSGRTKLIEGGLELFAERPLQGYGSGSFQKPSTSATARRPAAERDLGVAHDPDHGRRRAGDRRAGAVRGAAARRACSCCSAAPGARRRGSRSRPASRRSCCTPGPTRTSSRTRSRGRCWDRRGAGARRRARRSRAGARRRGGTGERAATA